MLYRKLGRTGLDVSVLGLGCAALGGAYGEIDEAEASRVVQTAFELGINYLDTAPLYGVTKSEAMLGKVLKGVPRDRYYISSKVGRYGYADSDFSYERVKQGLDASLERIGCGYLDIVILHDIEYVPLESVVNDGLRAVLEARSEGKVRFIGASGLPLKIYPAILAFADLDVVITYNNYTLQNTALESVLPLFESRSMGVINASPLGLGLLTKGGPQAWHLGSPELKRACGKAADWCSSNGIDIAELGMQFALAEPRVHSTLTGASKAEEVRRNAACVGKAPNPELVAAVQEILAPVQNQIWATGRPEYH